MARPREVAELDCEAPFALAAAQVVEVRAAELIDHSTGVLDIGDIERVHDMRVATRRLRAAMEIFSPCFPRTPYKAALKDVKALADALGERRDRDVAIVALERLTDEVGSADRRGPGVLVEDLREEQLQANEDLEPFVEADRLQALARRLAELVASARASVSEAAEAT